MPVPAPLAIPCLPAGLDRSWLVPGSKSITNRALVLAALAEGATTLENVLESDDTRHMRSALQAFGIAITDLAPGRLLVEGGRSRLRATSQVIFIGNSGTSVRFLTALAAHGAGSDHHHRQRADGASARSRTWSRACARWGSGSTAPPAARR